MSKEKLAAAKQFIEEKQYKEARLILESTNHPKATEWLSKLPKPAQPEKAKNSSSTQPALSPIRVISLITIIFLTFFVGFSVGMGSANIANGQSSYYLDMTRTKILDRNETTEALIRGTQTTSAREAEFNQTNNFCTCTTQTMDDVTPSPTLDPKFPTWTPTPR